jgi:hypothetical protein
MGALIGTKGDHSGERSNIPVKALTKLKHDEIDRNDLSFIILMGKPSAAIFTRPGSLVE